VQHPVVGASVVLPRIEDDGVWIPPDRFHTFFFVKNKKRIMWIIIQVHGRRKSLRKLDSNSSLQRVTDG
jgi:hypothetical protein